MTNLTPLNFNPQPKTALDLTQSPRAGAGKWASRLYESEFTVTLSGILMRTIAITKHCTKSMNWFESTALWRIIRASEREFGVTGFGINLCFLQWLHHLCLFIVLRFSRRISLSTTVCWSTSWIVISRAECGGSHNYCNIFFLFFYHQSLFFSFGRGSVPSICQSLYSTVSFSPFCPISSAWQEQHDWSLVPNTLVLYTCTVI